MRYVQDYNFRGKKALIRVDFNVSLDGHRVVDDTRIQGALPTIRKVLADGGTAILLSHLGRPQQGYEERFSLQPLVAHLTQALGTAVDFAPDCVGTEVQAQVKQLPPGSVLLLENVRFHAGETTGNPALAQALAALGDVYVNDAFGTAHRAHASTAVVAPYFEDKLAGCLMQQELASAHRVLQGAQRPFTAIVGGAKISDKIKPITHLLDRVDHLLVGGGVANTFQKALGGQLGASLLEEDQVGLALRLVEKAEQKGVQLVLPQDVVVAQRLEAGTPTAVVQGGGGVPDGWMALDIGPEAQQTFVRIVQASRTVLWCGPIGVFEINDFQHGTQAVAAAVAQSTALGGFSLIGGGDSAAAINQLGYARQVSYVSTGGGALLAYLGGARLPGVAILEEA